MYTTVRFLFAACVVSLVGAVVYGDCVTPAAHGNLPARIAVVPYYTILTYGDSKTDSDGFQAQMIEIMRQCDPYRPRNLNITTPQGVGSLGRGGGTVATMKAVVDADLATMDPDVNLRYVLFNLGVNDAGAGLPSEATWKANVLYIVDAFTAKYPNVHFYMMRPWMRGEGPDCDTLATWIADLPGLRANISLGPDERVFLENGDDGVTYTVEGIHPNAAGYTLTAQAWATVLGY